MCSRMVSQSTLPISSERIFSQDLEKKVPNKIISINPANVVKPKTHSKLEPRELAKACESEKCSSHSPAPKACKSGPSKRTFALLHLHDCELLQSFSIKHGSNWSSSQEKYQAPWASHTRMQFQFPHFTPWLYNYQNIVTTGIRYPLKSKAIIQRPHLRIGLGILAFERVQPQGSSLQRDLQDIHSTNMSAYRLSQSCSCCAIDPWQQATTWNSTRLSLVQLKDLAGMACSTPPQTPKNPYKCRHAELYANDCHLLTLNDPNKCNNERDVHFTNSYNDL